MQALNSGAVREDEEIKRERGASLFREVLGALGQIEGLSSEDAQGILAQAVAKANASGVDGTDLLSQIISINTSTREGREAETQHKAQVEREYAAAEAAVAAAMQDLERAMATPQGINNPELASTREQLRGLAVQLKGRDPSLAPNQILRRFRRCHRPGKC